MAELVDMSAEERERAERETLEAVRKSEDAATAAMFRQAAVSFAKGVEVGAAIARETMSSGAAG